MTIPALSFSPGARSTTDLFRDRTAIALHPANGALVMSVLSAICILLMCLLEDPWFAAAAFIPAYGVFWLNVRSAIKQREAGRTV